MPCPGLFTPARSLPKGAVWGTFPSTTNVPLCTGEVLIRTVIPRRSEAAPSELSSSLSRLGSAPDGYILMEFS